MNRRLPPSRRASRLAFPMLSAALLVAGCSEYASAPSVSLSVPSRDTFPAVHALLEPHCGTLDCHGSPARNLRIYGSYGLRASGDETTGGSGTTEADVDATYQSLISIDPEVLAAILGDRGKNPLRWIVITKARGTEQHVGGAPLPKGSEGDRCLTSWIAGGTDEAACNADQFGPAARKGESW